MFVLFSDMLIKLVVIGCMIKRWLWEFLYLIFLFIFFCINFNFLIFILVNIYLIKVVIKFGISNFFDFFFCVLIINSIF